ncbi:hypothetical protein [Sphaerochaeta globosa]|uniref:Uncharacterized protein n=1 Tax=Sphaerochaeta globosa (strain ATCC BAA-1886 / DSM 22777 / Buddy) TaxID=158189 RepID=F0RT67_SPHGB|nr:hypothetical protein [Sphaerochaeta globosa]ADY14372.1 hypothetical protein SpiBuddy_2561 [Sphaerochaeta globosa str. Buddy]
MDVKCVRILRAYEDSNDTEKAIYVDEAARYALIKKWGDSVMVRGRRDVKGVVIKALKELDQDGFIARANQALIDELFIEYGEEVLLI